MAENEKDKKSAPKAASKGTSGNKRGFGPRKDKFAAGGRAAGKGSGKSGAKSSPKSGAEQDKPRKPRVFGPKSKVNDSAEVKAAETMAVESKTPERTVEPVMTEAPVTAPEPTLQEQAPQAQAPQAPEPGASAAEPTAAAAASVAPAASAAQGPTAPTQPIVAVFEREGKKYGLNAAQLGQLIKNQYSKLNFPWKQLFWNYQRAHDMFPIMAQLKQGLDPVSVQYIDYHELLMNAAYVSEMTLVDRAAQWTNVDKRLMQRHAHMLKSETFAFLKGTTVDFSSQFTNFYGMYDLPIEVLQQVNGKAIIDGGAYIGDSIHLFKNLFGKSQIYSFEPVKSTFETLSKIFQADAAQGKVIPINKGLGSQAGSLRISRTRPANDALASLKVDYNVKDLYEEVEVTTIDQEVKERNLQVGLIKLNVEGFETEAIKGALHTIREQKPLLVISVGMMPQEFYELKPFIEQLNLGYKFALRRSGFGASPLTNFALIAYQPVVSTQEPAPASAPAANEA